MEASRVGEGPATPHEGLLYLKYLKSHPLCGSLRGRDYPNPHGWNAVRHVEAREDAMTLAEALAVVDAAGGRLSLVDGRVNVAVDRELSEPAWEALAAHKEELLASLAGQRVQPTTRLPQPAGVDRCDRCGSTETTDATIHNGQSIRRDCRDCGRFRKFTVWHGVVMP